MHIMGLTKDDQQWPQQHEDPGQLSEKRCPFGHPLESVCREWKRLFKVSCIQLAKKGSRRACQCLAAVFFPTGAESMQMVPLGAKKLLLLVLMTVTLNFCLLVPWTWL